MISIYCDGGSRGNPGLAAAACVVYESGELLHKESKFLGIATNNTAEYEALLLALKYIKDENISEDVDIVLDSQLVARQMQGKYKVKNEGLKVYFERAKTIEGQSRANITYNWARRHHNQEADALVNQELDKNVR